MNIHPVKSGYHFDSYHNLLCVMNGKKTVRLMEPGAPVRTQSLFSECYNHATKTPRRSYKLVVKKGQSLFIPEGWWHKVDSDENTVAVSFWWNGIDQGNLAHSGLDMYVARHSLRRLTLNFAARRVSKICEKVEIPGSLMRQVSNGDTELVYELLDEYPHSFLFKVRAT